MTQPDYELAWDMVLREDRPEDNNKEQKLIRKSDSNRCRCKHPTFAGERCIFRTCRHKTEHHYKA